MNKTELLIRLLDFQEEFNFKNMTKLTAHASKQLGIKDKTIRDVILKNDWYEELGLYCRSHRNQRKDFDAQMLVCAEFRKVHRLMGMSNGY